MVLETPSAGKGKIYHEYEITLIFCGWEYQDNDQIPRPVILNFKHTNNGDSGRKKQGYTKLHY